MSGWIFTLALSLFVSVSATHYGPGEKAINPHCIMQRGTLHNQYILIYTHKAAKQRLFNVINVKRCGVTEGRKLIYKHNLSVLYVCLFFSISLCSFGTHSLEKWESSSYTLCQKNESRVPKANDRERRDRKKKSCIRIERDKVKNENNKNP